MITFPLRETTSIFGMTMMRALNLNRCMPDPKLLFEYTGYFT
jgi:hypothetical protein